MRVNLDATFMLTYEANGLLYVCALLLTILTNSFFVATLVALLFVSKAYIYFQNIWDVTWMRVSGLWNIELPLLNLFS